MILSEAGRLTRWHREPINWPVLSRLIDELLDDPAFILLPESAGDVLGSCSGLWSIWNWGPKEHQLFAGVRWMPSACEPDLAWNRPLSKTEGVKTAYFTVKAI